VTVGLLTALLLLALADSLNPGSIVGLVYLLLTPRPVGRALAYVAGTFVSYFTGGALIFFGFGALFRNFLDRPFGAVGYLVLAAAGVLLLGVGEWLRSRPRRLHDAKPKPPRWLHPASTFLLGAAGTAADLPTAVPYLVGIGRMVSAGLGTAEALLVLALYVLVYTLPMLALAGAYLVMRAESAAFMKATEERVTRWSRPVIFWSCYVLGALLLANSAAFFLMGRPLL
jgi:cytochrome c biogenesis protein CcdA